MVFYFLLGGLFGIIIGITVAALLSISSKTMTEDNMLAYIDQLENENEELKEKLKRNK